MIKHPSMTLISAAALFCALFMPAYALDPQFPIRETAIPTTTNSVPHVQIGIVPVPELTAELLRRVANLPGVDIRQSVISLPGAKGFWLGTNVTLARPEAIVGGREFAHIHPDGSLHASLHPVTARAAVNTGWATPHPWAGQRPGWEGFSMIYTPTTDKELDVVFQLVVASYEFVTGRSLPK
jgi:hypothetical protein